MNGKGLYVERAKNENIENFGSTEPKRNLKGAKNNHRFECIINRGPK